jgi:hypothetical protein
MRRYAESGIARADYPGRDAYRKNLRKDTKELLPVLMSNCSGRENRFREHLTNYYNHYS